MQFAALMPYSSMHRFFIIIFWFEQMMRAHVNIVHFNFESGDGGSGDGGKVCLMSIREKWCKPHSIWLVERSYIVDKLVFQRAQRISFSLGQHKIPFEHIQHNEYIHVHTNNISLLAFILDSANPDSVIC